MTEKKRKLKIFIKKVHSFQDLLWPILQNFFFCISARIWFTGLKSCYYVKYLSVIITLEIKGFSF